MMRIAQVAATAAILVTTVLSAGCSSKSTVKPDGAAQSVVDVVSKQTGFHPTDVHCPSGVEAKVDVQFDCHFTGPEGKEYTANKRSPRSTAAKSISPSTAIQARPARAGTDPQWRPAPRGNRSTFA
jgi:hypothetical protein